MTRCRAPITAGSIALAILVAGSSQFAPRRAAAQAAPGDVSIKRIGPDSPLETPRVVFRHWRHRLFFTCNVCHPSVFPMKGGETPITMDEIQEGKLCGTCHNGRIAWGVSISTCARCHAGQ